MFCLGISSSFWVNQRKQYIETHETWVLSSRDTACVKCYKQMKLPKMRLCCRLLIKRKQFPIRAVEIRLLSDAFRYNGINVVRNLVSECSEQKLMLTFTNGSDVILQFQFKLNIIKRYYCGVVLCNCNKPLHCQFWNKQVKWIERNWGCSTVCSYFHHVGKISLVWYKCTQLFVRIYVLANFRVTRLTVYCNVYK